MGTITIDLPEKTISEAQQAAKVLQRPLEEMLSDMLMAMLPKVADAPEDMQAELTAMTWLDSNALWEIARSEMPTKKQEMMLQLVEQQNERLLTPSEMSHLDELRQEYGRFTLRKARAYALLSLRGGTPILDKLSSS
jgi:hypothetical protein